MAEGRSKTQHSTPVADDWNWTARVRNELNCNKAWQRNWGFLTEQQQQQRQSQSGNAAGPSGRDSLATFMQQSGPPGAPTGAAPSATTAAACPDSPTSLNYITVKQRDSARARRLEQQDSLDGFVSSYTARGDPRSRALPAQEFRKPLTTSQEYGWGRSLEQFGTLQLVMK